MMKKYTVNVAVTLFLEREVLAGDEEEAHQMAEDGITTRDVTKAFDSGDSEIEIIDSEVEEDNE